MGWPQIIAMAASVALQAKASHDAERKQDNLANQMTMYRMKKSQEGEAATKKFLETQTPQARAAENTAAANELHNSLDQSIGTAQAFETPHNFAGKVSDDYTRRAASNDQALGLKLKNLVNNLAAIGAPERRDFDTKLKLAQASGDVSAANSAAETVSGRFTDAMGNVRPDPFLTMGGQILAGYARSKPKVPVIYTGTGGDVHD